MSDTASKSLSQADFARRRGVSKKTVTAWKQKGLLVLDESGRVDVDASEWSLDQRPATYRGGVTHRPIRTNPVTAEAPPPKPARSPRPEPEAASPPPAPEEDGDGDGPFDPDDPNLTLVEAARRKENYLGLQRKQLVEKEAGRLIDRATAEALFFATARDLRDAWLAWPARIAVVMADELQVDARALTTVLTAHVQQHLAELGEPEAQL